MRRVIAGRPRAKILLNSSFALRGAADSMMRRLLSMLLRRRVIITMLLFLVMALSLGVGHQVDRYQARRRNAEIAADLNQSIQHVTWVALSHLERLARLVGQPCNAIRAALHPTDYITPYVRQITFVRNDVQYCSTVAGIDSGSLPVPFAGKGGKMAPLAAAATDPDELVRFSNNSQVTPGVPLLLIFERINQTDGILFVIEGTYIVDLLARAKASGQLTASVSARDGGTLDSHGVLRDTPPWPASFHRGGSIDVVVTEDRDQRRIELLATESVTMIISLALFGLSLVGYFAGFTPRQRLRRQVSAGLRRGEFFVVYQAVVEISTGRWRGAEALLRWNHPRFGPVAPSRFIREVETSKLIAPLTGFVLSTALSELGACRVPDGFHLSVNVAPCHIEMSAFAADILRAKQHGERQAVSPVTLILEVTERGLLMRTGRVQSNMRKLSAAGIKFAIDDFGIENSNLSMLQGFDFNYMKIDKMFVDGVDGTGRHLIEGIMLLAQKLGAEVVAEGVERIEQHQALIDIGVTYGQGFLYERPVLIEQFERDLAAAATEPWPMHSQQHFPY